MRITYRTLRALLDKMSPDQLDSDVTVEIFGGSDGTECFAAHLRICGEEHDSLENDHPVIYADMTDSSDDRRDDVDQIAVDIGLVP